MNAPAPGLAGSYRLGGSGSWYLLALLTLTATASLLDRQIITILAVDIKRDLGLSDAQLGMLYGTVFAVFNAVFSLPLGRLADGWLRLRQIATCLTAWSLATFACAFAGGFGSMAAARTVVAIGEAGSAPASASLIGDTFPRERRGTAFAVYTLAAVLGISLSSALGGFVVDSWNAAFAGGRGWFGLVGWQAAFIVASLPGLVLAILLAVLREPPRGLADGIVSVPERHPFARAAAEILPLLPIVSLVRLHRIGAPGAMIRTNLLLLAGCLLFTALATAVTSQFGGRFPAHLLQWSVVGIGGFAILSWIQAQKLADPPAAAVMWRSPAFIALVVVLAANNMMIYGVMGWMAPFAVQSLHASLSEVGVRVASAGLTAGVIGTLAGGWIADRARRLHPAGRIAVLLAATVLPVPFGLLAYSATTIESWYFWFMGMSLVLTPWLPCATAALQDLVLPRMRGTTMAFYTLAYTIFGMGTGPYLVGLISDATGDLGFAIRCIFLVSPIVWIACLVAMRSITRDEATLLDRARLAGEPV